jgi:hypothetical protein
LLEKYESLEKVNIKKLGEKFNQKIFKKNNIYPNIWRR